MLKGERIANLVLLLVLIIFLVEAQNIPSGFMVESVRREVGADFWPKALLAILIFLTVILNIRGWFFEKKSGTAQALQPVAKEHWRKWVLLGISILIYIEIQSVFGFIPACLLIIGFSLFNFGYRRPLPLIMTSIGFTTVFLFVFGRFLNVPLPKGMGVFRSISTFFY